MPRQRIGVVLLGLATVTASLDATIATIVFAAVGAVCVDR